MFVCFLQPEDIIIQIVKGSRQTSTEPNVYELEITAENRTYPAAYDLCQAILEKECLEDPFICGKSTILPHVNSQ